MDLQKHDGCGFVVSWLNLSGLYSYMTMPTSIVVAIACWLALWVPLANAQTFPRTCPGVDVSSIRELGTPAQNLPLDTKQETIEIATSTAETQDITVVAQGPVLGSMDSEAVST